MSHLLTFADADNEEEALEDEVFVLESIAEAKKNDEEKLRVTLLVSLRETVASITKILDTVEVNHTNLSSFNVWRCQRLRIHAET